MKHVLKTWPEQFQAIWVGDKKFEIRKNDRDFQERDEIALLEWDPEQATYTNREIHGFIRYLVPGGKWGLPDGICVFGFEEKHRSES